jgi:Mg2+ and Co2+ transporter CorA
MEKRMQNLIHLSFNLVAQHDSKSFQVDNKLLMLIALLTLIFLPASTIASIFGSQFFVFDDGSKGDNGVDLKMSRQFWVFWVLVIPVTGVVLLAGWLYFKRVRRIVTEQSRPSRVPTWASENSGDAV